DAARHGFSGILSAGYYLDHMEPASTLYAVDPMDNAALLNDEEQARILGGEVAMWGEFVSPENIDSRIWPRAAAVAERLWSPREVKDVPSMYRRLDQVSGELDRQGLTHRASFIPMLERLAAGESVGPLKTLAEVVEPATFGQRIRTHKYSQLTPLNRLVDVARPESDTAREFATMIDRMDRVQLRIWLNRWRDNNVPGEPASEVLRRVSGIGLEALGYLDRNQRPPDTWPAQQRAFLETLKKPVGELRIAIAPSIERLVSAAASQP
ncbi:MAG: family 20 glycosylhydrolase, partial [Bryobacteraceae bacterium]